ncbi:hypothetical protein ARMSODRAFT_449973 [Armillaria solidipes]|uniref:Uncharacterized protein n=1 Tax=Armillaria solidipes TaxID=1076256 RepID=A0A2H3B5R1_9AGAR|nr:hypothetical protein ARMSODRAFT_449973 [Armillaria solidipes]
MTKLSNWIPCTGCACPNHHLPSYTFNLPTKLSDNPNWAHLSHSNNAPSPGEESVLLATISLYDFSCKASNWRDPFFRHFFMNLKPK